MRDERMLALWSLVDTYHPAVRDLINRRLYEGFRPFRNHKLAEGLSAGDVRLALDLIRLIRPDEEFTKEEQDLIRRFEPRLKRATRPVSRRSKRGSRNCQAP